MDVNLVKSVIGWLDMWLGVEDKKSLIKIGQVWLMQLLMCFAILQCSLLISMANFNILNNG